MASCALFVLLRHNPLALVWLEDLPVYTSALQAFLTGGDPYAVNHYGLHFVYPPLVLFFARWCAYLLPLHVLRLLFVSTHIFSILVMPFALARFYLRARWWGRYLPLLVLAAEPAFIGFRALYSANIAPTVYLAALLAAVPGVRRNRWNLFYFVVVAAALIKVTFLVLLLLPLLASTRQWLRSIACSAIVIGANLLQRQLVPALYGGYKAALVQQIRVQSLYGFGVFGFAARVEHHFNAAVGLFAYSFHAVFVLLMLGMLFALKYRNRVRSDDALSNDHTGKGMVWSALLVIAVILANPRVLHYDMYIALIAAYVIVASQLQIEGWKLVALAILFQLPSALLLAGISSYALQTGWALTLAIVAFAVGVRRLWQRSPALEVVVPVSPLAPARV